MKKTNLYIVNEVLYDYTEGMVVIVASSIERCREIFQEQFCMGYQGDQRLKEFDEAIRLGVYKVLQVVDREEGVVSYVYGGG